MRRGHPGSGGWRNDNSRQFRPRSSGPQHFRYPQRGFGLLETQRFPPPNARATRGPPPFNNHPNQGTNSSITEHHDRNKYRHDYRQNNQYRSSDRGHHQSQRSIFPLLDRFRQKDTSDPSNQYTNYYNDMQREPSHLNSMGDVDHRQQGNVPKGSDPYKRHPISPWSNQQDAQRQFYDDRSKYKYQKHDSMESNKFPTADYTGHRPPASDHYGGNPSSSIDNSHSFSRSVDDTVDIVRRRLQNRNEPQSAEPVDHHDEDLRVPISMPGTCQNSSQEHIPKKRIQRQRQDRSVESNCDKMKNKIVQQLFKMDKDRIHKLMDNPSSSSKFEYAISSLINESQNSLNKHLRSVAEKSLSSSEEFIHNDNNTIYEDTFMKQMQHILDPQDTVLLEDIKPLVLAELSKVLQLNEYDQPFQMIDEQGYHQVDDQHNYDTFSSAGTHAYDDISQSQQSYYDQIDSPPVGYEDYGNSHLDLNQLKYEQPEEEKPRQLFERRPVRKDEECQPEPRFSPVEQIVTNVDSSNLFEGSREEFPSFVSERRHSRKSIESKKGEGKCKEPDPQIPLFDANASQLSEEDDPFAELDRQYHVAVDPNFLDTDMYSMSSPQRSSHPSSRSSSKNREHGNQVKTPSKGTVNVKQEIDEQLHSLAKSPLKLRIVTSNIQSEKSTNVSNAPIKNEPGLPTKENTNTQNKETKICGSKEVKKESVNVDTPVENSQNIITASSKAVSSSSRKRSIDQKPSHRKEKRKKSETSQGDSSQQILNKNIIINVNDCANDKDKCTESAKSIFNLFFSKNENSKDVSKDTKKVEAVDKSYSDKYVKRKETSRKSKDKDDEQKKRRRSDSTSHSTVSSKDSTQTSKTDPKSKLQSIDIFSEQPKKMLNKHQAHRNTAISPNTPTKPVEVMQTKQTLLTFSRKVTKKQTGTQVIRNINEIETQTEMKTISRPCQTENKKMISRLVQTLPISPEKSKPKATDAFERMKEIDMEIQVLLQEKFKLYSSLESNTSCPSTTLGMTVLNMPLNEVGNEDNESENAQTEDGIVDDFTSIPVEELEKIALETVNEPEIPQGKKKIRRHKISEESRASSSSPTIKKSARKAGKTPNISLLEQILTDDRPIEDIISLDDLETTPVKTKKKSAKKPKKKPSKKGTTKVGQPQTLNSIAEYNLKEVSVVLLREDLSKFLTPKDVNIDAEPESSSNQEIVEVTEKPLVVSPYKSDTPVFNDSDIVEETVVENAIQIDMLDVSEDIVIGDICEVKSSDKEAERSEVITEEIILDNSQSSAEPAQSESGPGEDICKMYDYSTDENLRRDALTVSGHADAVLAIECVENNFVAACLDGNVYHFSGDGQLLSTLRGSNLAVTCLTIVKEKYGTTVYTGSLDSRIRYYDLERGVEKGPECNVLSPIQTMDRAWDTIFVGTRTGFVLQFECKNNMLIPVSTVKFSDQSILALRAMKEGPRKVLLVAARSEDVTIKDAQTGLLLRSLQGPKMTVYTLLYEEGKVYCGTSSHQIHVFDYASGSHAGVHEGGKGAVCLRASGGLLFAGCYDGCVYVYREGEARPLAQLRGPSLMLLSLAVVGSKIIAGYKDRSLYIWKIPLGILQEMIL